MATEHITLSGKRLTTPRAAALAGIMFSVLFTSSVLLIRNSMPTEGIDQAAWLESGAKQVKLALFLLPFAGICFLWFIGVVRDRLGSFEDQFFSTVFYSSAILFLAMVFAAAAVTGAFALSLSQSPETSVEGIFMYSRLLISQLFTIYAMRMAGVFVASLGTIWFRTGLMPRWLSFLTFVFALALTLTMSVNLWVAIVFPTWVLVISIYILYLNLAARPPAGKDGMTIAPAEN